MIKNDKNLLDIVTRGRHFDSVRYLTEKGADVKAKY
jgi:hypothetical protein